MGFMEKVEKLVRLGHQAVQAYIDALSDEEKAIVGNSDDWSPKDILAHMTAWKEQIVLNYQASKSGETEPVQADYQAMNAEFFEKHSSHSWDEVLSYHENTHRALLAELENITEADLERTEGIPMQAGRPFWRMVVGIAYTHPMGHLRDPVLARGDFERAVEMQEEICQLLSELDDDQSWMGAQQYNLACTYSLVGQKEKAIRILDKALKMTPELVDWSKEDPDFEPIREHPDYKAIYKD
jgi:tetratricopeptide (TPR) repeat protein